jgi:UDP-glucose 4-epimerase
MKKVLVTGGAGFIGSHLVDALVKEGAQVTVLDDLSTGKEENLKSVADQITFIKHCVADYAAAEDVAKGKDIIFHLAAIASVQKSVEDPLKAHMVNATGTLSILDGARKQKVPRVIYASSSAVYGSLPDLPKTEMSPCCPTTPYGLQKMIGEGYAKLYSELYGLQTTGLRFFNVFGPRQDPSSPYSGVISIFKENIAKGEPITIFGDGKTTRDFVYVGDVVASLLAAAEKEDAGNVYNIGTGVETSLLDVVSALEHTLGVTAEVSSAPERIGDIKRSVADISKAKQELGWEPTVSFEEGIARMIR